MLRIFYSGLRHNNYDPRRGESFEHANIYSSLTAYPGAQVRYFAFDRILEVGKHRFNRELLAAIKAERPDVLFVFMYTDEILPATLTAIRMRTRTKSLAWFADDYWRFWNYSRDWAPRFDWAVTTSPQAFAWYRAAGIGNVVRSQWGCNAATYGPRQAEKDIDVSFVGQRKSSRALTIDALRGAGIRVEAFGSGWSSGRVAQDSLPTVFARSKINLNLNDRPSRWEPRVLARLVVRKSVNRVVPDLRLGRNLKSWWRFALPHTHARLFELGGCRAFTISGRSDGVTDYYAEDREVVYYDGTGDLVEKVRYYLAHDEERERIAGAAYERTLREHTYERRFDHIFHRMGFK